MFKFKRYIIISVVVFIIFQLSEYSLEFNLSLLKITLIVIFSTYLLVNIGKKLFENKSEVE